MVSVYMYGLYLVSQGWTIPIPSPPSLRTSYNLQTAAGGRRWPPSKMDCRPRSKAASATQGSSVGSNREPGGFTGGDDYHHIGVWSLKHPQHHDPYLSHLRRLLYTTRQRNRKRRSQPDQVFLPRQVARFLLIFCSSCVPAGYHVLGDGGGRCAGHWLLGLDPTKPPCTPPQGEETNLRPLKK